MPDDTIQRAEKPLKEEEEKIQMKTAGKGKAPKEEEELLQIKPIMMKSEGGESTATPALATQLNSTKGGGKSLAPDVNASMSNAFGTDFSHVRVHTDTRATQMNQDLHAKAFTHGSDIYFNQGQYAPTSSQGKRLLAHELTHVNQQIGTPKIQMKEYASMKEYRQQTGKEDLEVGDWLRSDRINFTWRWNRANVINLMTNDYNQYSSIEQRAAFYNWFDQIREIQGHEIEWTAAAYLVAEQMSNVTRKDKSTSYILRGLGNVVDFTGVQFVDAMTPQVQALANEGNKAIFNDVFPNLRAVYTRGLQGKPITGKEAKEWDAETLRHEQFEVVDPIYKKQSPQTKKILQEMASGDVFLVISSWLSGLPDFKGDINSPQDRYDYGMELLDFYHKYKDAIDAERKKRQRSKPDPSARGMVRYQRGTASP